ncbi:MAG: hypothetical protein WA771_06995 [Chthoniobacterales bacterium]
MTWLLIAGGLMLTPTAVTETTTFPELYNHTLLGELVLADEVVCRNRFGTPMLPDGTGGYSLIAPINEEFIARSLFIPPVTSGVAYRPLPPIDTPTQLNVTTTTTTITQ